MAILKHSTLKIVTEKFSINAAEIIFCNFIVLKAEFKKEEVRTVTQLQKMT